MATIKVDYEGYKEMASEFFSKAKEANTTYKQVVNGFKSLGIAYLGMVKDEDEKPIKGIFMKLVLF